MKLIRTASSIFYDELWAEHVRLSSGKIIHPFEDKVPFGKLKPDEGFVKDKTREFKFFDSLFISLCKTHSITIIDDIAKQFIKYADNRMIQGDYRYGRVTRQSLEDYDLIKECFKRIGIAIETKNIEYIVDAYNIIRLYYYSNSKIDHDIIRMIVIVYDTAIVAGWKFISIDDGHHATPNKK